MLILAIPILAIQDLVVKISENTVYYEYELDILLHTVRDLKTQ